jgi:hypothetical protein
MKRAIFVTGTVLLLTLALTGVAFAQGQDEPDTTSMAEAATVLAPLAAAALGIERLLETFWGIVESVFAVLDKFPFVRMTEAQLAASEDSEENKRKKAGYGKFKTWTSAAAGIVLGIWVAFAAKLMMFDLIGLDAVDKWDKLITGLVIGSGSKFTHDVIGIFSETKKLIEQGAELVKSKKKS